MDYWLVNAFGFIGAAFLLYHVTIVARTAFNPAVVFSIPWAINIALSQFAFDGLIRPRATTLLILFAAWWAFMIGAFFATARKQSNRYTSYVLYPVRCRVVLFVLVGLHVATVLYEIANVGVTDMSVQSFAIARLSDDFNSIKTPMFFGTFRWSFVVYIPVALWLRSNRVISRSTLWIVLATALASTLLRFTRAPFIQYLVVTFVAWNMFFRPTLKTKVILSATLLSTVIVVFLFMQYALMANDQYAQVTFGDSVWAYFGGTAKAFEMLLDGKAGFPDNGWYSLEFINFVLSKLGIISSYPDIIRPEVMIPIRTNIFTFLDCFTMDAGVPGAIMGAAATGAVAAWVFQRQYRDSGPVTAVSIGYVTYGCAMAAANNEFIRFNLFLNIALALVVTRLISSRRIAVLSRPGIGYRVLSRVGNVNAFDGNR